MNEKQHLSEKSNAAKILNFYGLSFMPFGKHVPSQEIFPSSCLQDAQIMLEMGVETEDILLLCGPVGCGKSIAIRYFMRSLDTNCFLPVYLTGNINSPSELYKRILQGLLIEPPFSPTKAKTVYFKAVGEMSKKPLIFIDDAQDMKDTALHSIKSMINFEQDSQNKITFILCGEPELKENLSYSGFTAIRQRIKLEISLRGMNLQETCAYVDHCLKACGRAAPVFSDNAKSEIFNRSEGIARKINKICFKALIWGAINKKEIIDSKDIPADDF